MRQLLLAAVAALFPLQAFAQSWGDLDALLFQNLTTSGTAEASYWLPDNPDPAQAQKALGFAYEYIPGSAGNTGIAIGLFRRQGTGWVFEGAMGGVYGQSPRDAAFAPSYVEVTTTMPGPNDPRCCPTKPTRWRIDLQTMAGQRLP